MSGKWVNIDKVAVQGRNTWTQYKIHIGTYWWTLIKGMVTLNDIIAKRQKQLTKKLVHTKAMLRKRKEQHTKTTQHSEACPEIRTTHRAAPQTEAPTQARRHDRQDTQNNQDVAGSVTNAPDKTQGTIPEENKDRQGPAGCLTHKENKLQTDTGDQKAPTETAIPRSTETTSNAGELQTSGTRREKVTRSRTHDTQQRSRIAHVRAINKADIGAEKLGKGTDRDHTQRQHSPTVNQKKDRPGGSNVQGHMDNGSTDNHISNAPTHEQKGCFRTQLYIRLKQAVSPPGGIDTKEVRLWARQGNGGETHSSQRGTTPPGKQSTGNSRNTQESTGETEAKVQVTHRIQRSTITQTISIDTESCKRGPRQQDGEHPPSGVHSEANRVKCKEKELDAGTSTKQAHETQAQEEAAKSTTVATKQETTQKPDSDRTCTSANAVNANTGHHQATAHPHQAARENMEDKSTEEKAIATAEAGMPTPNQWRQACQQDVVIQAISEYIQHGWPPKTGDRTNSLRDYWGVKDNLYVADSILWNANKMVVPRSMRKQVKDMAYRTKDKDNNHERIEDRFWWPHIDKDLKEANSQAERQIDGSKQKDTCETQEESTANQLQSWHTISLNIIDLLDTGEEGTIHAIIIEDTYSTWPEVKLVSNITTQMMITLLKELFAREGIPHSIQIGEGISFRSEEMEHFIATHGIRVQQIKRRNQASDSTMEPLGRRLIDSIRAAGSKGREWRTDVRNILCNIRNTKVQGKDKTPFQLMRGRNAIALRRS